MEMIIGVWMVLLEEETFSGLAGCVRTSSIMTERDA